MKRRQCGEQWGKILEKLKSQTARNTKRKGVRGREREGENRREK